MRIKLFVETENNSAGTKRSDVRYPFFSDWACTEKMESVNAENMEQILYRKITIEDGDFENGYGKKHKFDKYSYLGQHTNLVVSLINGVNENAPKFVYGSIFHRNKYGSTKRHFRLDLERQKIQIMRGKYKKWCDFTPKHIID